MLSLLKKLTLKFTLTAITALAFWLPIEVKAMPEILPLDQIQNGMSGVAYTVVDNSGKIEPFNVDIIGLIDNGKGSSKMIMAKASGAVIDKTGGVLQGMSGSPVYINGKLVGALAAGLKEMSPYTFFITPIEDMLPLWDMPDPKAENKYQQVDLKTEDNKEKKSDVEEVDKDKINTKDINQKSDNDKDKDKNKSKSEKVDKKSKNDKSDKKSDKKSDNKSKTDKKSKSDKSKKKDQPVKKDEPVEDKLPVETPKTESKHSSLFVDGFDSRGLQFLSNELGLKELLISNSTTGKSNVDYNATLEPGSPVGVAIICGDFSVGATGTITAVDGKKILGFGHSFTHTGNVNFFMTDAAVIGSISGENGLGVKIANIGNIIGRINQDRDTGVAGIIGKFPSVVPINVKINDKVLGKSETYNSLMAYNETFIPKLGAAIAYTALSRTSDSLSESTVDVNFSIKTNAISSGKIERKNTFYNATDVGQVAVIELLQALNLVCSNTTQESDIFSIDVDMTFDNERRTASLVSAVPNKTKVKPGETVELDVTLQPYRKKNEKIKISYTVPVTMKEGPLTLDLHGGALIPISQALANSGFITSTENNDAAKNYNDKINELINSGRNNQIVVEPGGVTEPKSDRELKREIARAKKAQEKALKAGKKATTQKETKVDTNYIIDNVIHTTIEVEKI